MALLKFTQEHIDASSFTIDQGWYTLKVEEFELGESKKDKSTIFIFKCVILEADDEGNAKFAGKKTRVTFSEKGMGFMIPFLNVFGADIPAHLPEGESFDVDPKGCIGGVFKGQNNPQLDKTGKMQNNWNTFAPAV